MPLSGIVPITRGQSIIPSGTWVSRGGDGGRYVVVGSQGVDVTAQIKVASLQTLTTIWTRNHSEWSADVASLILNGGSGPITAPIFSVAQGPIVIPGTEYFYIPGNAEDTSGNFWVVLLRYRIESSTLIEVDGAVVYKRIVTDGVAPGNGCWCFGANVVNDELFAVCWMFYGTGTYLLRLPKDGFGTTVIITDTAVWTSRRTFIGGASAFGDTLGVSTYFINPIDYFNRCVILKSPTDDDTVRILTYRSHDSVPSGETDLTTPGSEYVDVNHAAQIVGSLTNAQSLLGQPWADDTGTKRYTGPSYKSGELIFGQIDQSNQSLNTFRRFTYNELTGTFTAVDAFTVTISGGHILDSRAVLATREGSDLLIGRYGVGRWNLGQYTLAFAGDDIGCEGEDFADEVAPCDVTWDPCVLVPEDITVEIVPQTQSPGPALSGRRQVIQFEPGRFRITLHGVKVWSNTELLTWREYESLLNGRNGTCCVPLYEAKLSAISIAATLGADAAIGDIRLTINQTTGATIRRGMHFQVGEYAYRLVSGSGTAWKVCPPLREAITSGTALNFNTPSLRCRLERDDGMNIKLGLLKFAKPDVVFVEDV